MRKLCDSVDRFCLQHPRFGIPNLMLIIVIGNAAVWLLAQMDTTGQIVSLLSGSAQGILHGQVWRLITYVFVPTESRPIWLLLMLYFYYWIGSCLEREWGNGKFTIYYVSGMLLTAIYGVVLSAILGRDVVVSTTYLNLSMFFAFATLYPDVQVLLMFLFPIKVKWLGIVYGIILLVNCIQGGIATWIVVIFSLLNFLVFFLRSKGKMHLSVGQIRRQQEFHQKMRSAGQTKGITRHKCAVCGRTELDGDDLEFRFCSKCNGNYEYCQYHLFTHEHVK